MSDNGGWISLETWCERYNEVANTVHKRVHDGLWPRGEIYSTPDGGDGFVHEKRAVEWLELRGKLS